MRAKEFGFLAISRYLRWQGKELFGVNKSVTLNTGFERKGKKRFNFKFERPSIGIPIMVKKSWVAHLFNSRLFLTKFDLRLAFLVSQT